MKKFNSYAIITILATMFTAYALTSCESDKKTTALVSDYKETALRAGDQAKMKMISTAANAYMVETGERPASAKDLVKAGYLAESDVIDHNGKPLPFSPDTIFPDQGVIKTCGSCGATVSPDSKVGDRCPFCGVTWGRENKTEL